MSSPPPASSSDVVPSTSAVEPPVSVSGPDVSTPGPSATSVVPPPVTSSVPPTSAPPVVTDDPSTTPVPPVDTSSPGSVVDPTSAPPTLEPSPTVPPVTPSAGPASSDNVQVSPSAPVNPSSSASVSASSQTSATSQSRSTSYVYETVTDASGATSTLVSAVAEKGHKSNTGAIVGGVVGGVLGAALVAALLWFLCVKRKRSKDAAFDDKMFDPHHSTRHSQADPLDMHSPATVAATTDKIEPYVYDNNVAGAGTYEHGTFEQPQHGYDNYEQHAYENTNYEAGQQHYENGAQYDPYGHAPMAMPDHRDYMGQGYGAYSSENPYQAAGVAGAGVAAAAGASAYAAHGQHDYSDDPYAAAGGQTPMTAAAAAKHREAQADRSRSPQEGNSSSVLGSRPPSGFSTYEDAQSNQTHGMDGADGVQRNHTGDGSVYQHADMMAEPGTEGLAEIPPNYHSIPRPQ